MTNTRVTQSYDYNTVCDVCGFNKKAHQLRRRWDGKMVCTDDWETRHIADFYATRNDTHTLPFTRPQEGKGMYPVLGRVTSALGSSAVTYTRSYTITGAPAGNWDNNTGPYLTAMAWVRLDAPGARMTIISNKGNSNVTAGTWSLDVGGNTTAQNNGALFCTVVGGAARFSVSNVIPLGIWTHVCWVRNTTDFLYVNGIPVSLTDSTVAPTALTQGNGLNINLGCGVTGNGGDPNVNSLVGAVRDIRVWGSSNPTAALSATDIRGNMQSYQPNRITGSALVQQANLIGWWKCDGGTTTFTDSSSNNSTLTATLATDITWAYGKFNYGSL